MPTSSSDYGLLNLETSLSKTVDRLLESRYGYGGRVPSRLSDSIRYSLLAPGKRIRPRLALACGRMTGLEARAALHGALALEMIHCYTLIHDDLPCMDDDDYRRGRPSNHKKFDEATALLAGSALASMAFDCLLETQDLVKPEYLLAATRRLSWAMGVHGVIAGQSAEMYLNEHSTLEDLREMHAQKTGALFTASLLVPADLAGVDSESREGQALHAFARDLGLAFQVMDDLEDNEQDFRRDVSKGSNQQKPAGASSQANILYYLPEEAARSVTLESLSQAIHGLVSAWDEAANPLALIANEVAQKLTRSSRS